MRKLYVFLASLLLFVSVSYNSVIASQSNPSSVNSTVIKLEGCQVSDGGREFGTTAAGRHAVYFFMKDSDRSRDEMLAIVRKYELILDFAKNKLDLNFTEPDIYILDELVDFEISRKKTIIYPEDSSWIGAILSNASAGELPAWLCSGIELYCLNNVSLLDKSYNSTVNVKLWTDEQSKNGFPSFGDAWFYPGFIDASDSSIDNAKIVSLNFVKKLAENGKLTNIVSEYMSDRAVANKKIQESWVAFAGKDVPIDSNIRYTYQSKRYGVDQSLLIHAARQDYYFYEDGWKWEAVQKYINDIEDSRDFVNNWFNAEYAGKLTVKLYQTQNNTTYLGSYDGDSVINYYGLGQGHWESTTHEMTHAFLDILVKPVNSLNILEEGIASYVHQLHEEYKPGQRAKRVAAMMEYTYDESITNKDFASEIVKKVYTQRNGAPYKTGDKIDLNLFGDCIALLITEYPKYVSGVSGYRSLVVNTITDEKYSTDIKFYEQSCSFVDYLLRNYGKDKLIKAYCDADKIEEIYSKDIWKLVDDWKRYLKS